jgi:hypothetical protein
MKPDRQGISNQETAAEEEHERFELETRESTIRDAAGNVDPPAEDEELEEGAEEELEEDEEDDEEEDEDNEDEEDEDEEGDEIAEEDEDEDEDEDVTTQ